MKKISFLKPLTRVGTVGLLYLLFCAQMAIAQGVEHGAIIKIKLTENAAQKLTQSAFTYSKQGFLQTGLSNINRVAEQVDITKFERVFRPAGKYEAKHRKYGLHLWYEVSVAEISPNVDLKALFESLPEVQMVDNFKDKQMVPVIKTEPNGTVNSSNDTDPFLPYQWAIDNYGQDGGLPDADIDLLKALKLIEGSKDVIVSVHDTGIYTDHEDLKDNMWINKGEIPDNGIDDDNNGYIDDIYGFNFSTNTDHSFINGGEHGTHVAGTVAAKNLNGLGVMSAAGGSDATTGVQLMTCGIFDLFTSGGIEDSYVYAADNGAVISQNSWGYTRAGAYEQSVLDAIDYFIAEAGYDENGDPYGPMQGGILIFAAGNDGESSAHYPAFYDRTIAVAASDRNDQLADFSNYGDYVDITAPGVDILSTSTYYEDFEDYYEILSGTSMACPQVTSVAALIVSKYAGNITPDQVREKLLRSADRVSSLGEGTGSGRLNAYRALMDSQISGKPEAITNFKMDKFLYSKLRLSWTAPSTENTIPDYFEIRYSRNKITAENYNNASILRVFDFDANDEKVQVLVDNPALSAGHLYFAIKSIDVYGNASDISNVFFIYTPPSSQSPVFNCNDDDFNATVNVTRSPSINIDFLIGNKGASGSPLSAELKEVKLLDYDNFSDISYELPPNVLDMHWVRYVNTSVYIHSNSYEDIDFTFEAVDLPDGKYTIGFMLETNDPNNEFVQLTGNLTVRGHNPEVSIEQSVLQFGSVFVGDTLSKMLTITNNGMGALAIKKVTSDNNQYSLKGEDKIFVAPKTTASFPINFHPKSVAYIQEEIQLWNKLPDQDNYVITGAGVGMSPPKLGLDKSTYALDLNYEETTEEALILKNQGAYPLSYSFESTTLKDQLLGNDGHSGTDFDFGYRWRDSQSEGGPEFNWIDISQVGTRILYSESQDSHLLDFGFQFPFYGQNYSRVSILDNGVLAFDYTGELAYSDWSNPIPTPNDNADNFIAPYGGDMRTPDYSYGEFPTKIYYYETDSSLIVQYQDLRERGGLIPANFEVILYKSGDIVFNYLEIENAHEVYETLVGIENADGTDGFTIVHRQRGKLLKDHMSIAISPNRFNFIETVSPSEGVILPQQSATVNFTVNSEGVNNGDHTNYLRLTSSDPQKKTMTIPVRLTMNGSADLEIKNGLDWQNALEKDTVWHDLLVTNRGNKDAIIDTIEVGNSHFIVKGNYTGKIIKKQRSINLIVGYLAEEIGEESSYLNVLLQNMHSASFDLKANTIEAPQISVNTDTLEYTITTKGVKYDTITFKNLGGSPLSYKMSGNYWLNAKVIEEETNEVARQKEDFFEGKDSFGYKWSHNSLNNFQEYNWIEISAIGENITDDLIFSGKVAGRKLYKLPMAFDFPFYGKTYDSLWVSSYSDIYFGADEPRVYAQNHIKALSWDYLITPYYGKAYYYSNEEYTVFQFNQVEGGIYSSGRVTFQVVLYPSGKIVFNYKNVVSFSLYYACDIGISNEDGSDGFNIQQIVGHSIDIPNGDQTSIIITPPSSSELSASKSQKVKLSMDPKILENGVNYGSLRIQSNDPLAKSFNIPIKVTLDLKDELTYSEDTLNFETIYIDNGNASKEMTLLITNETANEVMIDQISFDNNAFSFDTDGFSIDGFNQMECKINFESEEMGDYSGFMTMVSTTGEVFQLPLLARVAEAPHFSLNNDYNYKLKNSETKTEVFPVLNDGGSKLDMNIHTTFDNQGNLPCSDSLYYTTSSPLSYVGSGLNGNFFYSAAKFVSGKDGFLLSYVSNWIKTDDNLSDFKINIYSGGASPAEGNLLYSQPFKERAEQGGYLYLTLNKSIHFSAGEVFWVEFEFPKNMLYPQGYSYAEVDVDSDEVNMWKIGSGVWKPISKLGTQINAVFNIGVYSRESKYAYFSHPVSEIKAGETNNYELQLSTKNISHGVHKGQFLIKTNIPEQELLMQPFDVTVNSIPYFDPPVADTVTVNEGELVQIDINSKDDDGTIDSYILGTQMPNMYLYTDNGQTKLQFTPNFYQSGHYPVRVGAVDDAGDVGYLDFVIEVKNVNREPEVILWPEDQTVQLGESIFPIELSQFFNDPDREELNYSVFSSNANILGANVVGTYLYLSTLDAGKAYVSIVAVDGNGAAASVYFEVTIQDNNVVARKVQVDTDSESVLNNEFSLKMYPNPAQQFVALSYQNDSASDILIEVVSSKGQVLQAIKESGSGYHTSILSIAQLNPGVYMIKVQMGGKIVTERLVKE